MNKRAQRSDDLIPRSKRVKFTASATANSGPSTNHRHQSEDEEDEGEGFDDAVLESLERDHRVKQQRRGFKMDGYGSADSASDYEHSEDDDEDGGDKDEQRKRRSDEVAAVEEEDDMFGDGDVNDSTKSGGSNKVRSITEEALEAQEENPSEENQFTEIVEELTDSARRRQEGGGDGGEDADVISKKHIPIEPFNLKEEMQEGSFDQEGVYTERRDENRHHDTWLQGISAGDIKKAAKAHRLREEQGKQRAAEEARQSGARSKTELLEELLEYLQPGENALKLMHRLKPPKQQSSKKQQQQQLVVMITEDSRANSASNKALIERVTEIADRLMQLGYFSAYEDSREDIELLTAKAKTLSAQNIISNTNNQQPQQRQRVNQLWQYKWSADGEIFGPFTSHEMHQWSIQGFFSAALPVLVRPVRLNADGSVSTLASSFQPADQVQFT